MANRILTTMLSAAAGAGSDTYWSTEFKQDSGLNIAYSTVAKDVAVDSDDNIYVSANISARSSGSKYGAIYKFDTDTGCLSCYVQIGCSSPYTAAGLSIDTNGCVYVAGDVGSPSRSFVARYSGSLSRDWTNEQKSQYSVCGTCHAPTIYGGVVWVAHTSGYGGDNNQRPTYTVYYQSNGVQAASYVSCSFPVNSAGVGNGLQYISGNKYYTWTMYNGTDTRVYASYGAGTMYSFCFFGASSFSSGKTSSDGTNIYFAGGARYGTQTQGALVKVNTSSAIQWSNRVCITSNDFYFNGSTVDTSSNVVYAFGRMSDNTYPYDSGSRGVLMSFNTSDGSFNWAKCFYADVASRDPEVSIDDAAVDSRGNIFIVGSIYDEFQAHTSNAPKQSFIMKLPKDGSTTGTYGNIQIGNLSGYSIDGTQPTRVATTYPINLSNPYACYTQSGLLTTFADCYDVPCYQQTTII